MYMAGTSLMASTLMYNFQKDLKLRFPYNYSMYSKSKQRRESTTTQRVKQLPILVP